MVPRSLIVTAVAAVAITTACSKPPEQSLQLDGNILTVRNATSQNWTGVEIWLNTYYRETTPVIQAGGVFRAPLDVFVEGYGGRFDFRRAQITDLRLTAKQSDGTPVEVKMQFRETGLAGLGTKGRTQ